MIESLYQVTPTVRSNKLSQLNRRNVYLKLDNCQASGSFKLRGLGHMILKVNKSIQSIKQKKLKLNLDPFKKNYTNNKIENIVTSSGGKNVFFLLNLIKTLLRSLKSNSENILFLNKYKGNAGLAAAYCGQTLKVKTTIVTPTTTSELVVNDLK